MADRFNITFKHGEEDLCEFLRNTPDGTARIKEFIRRQRDGEVEPESEQERLAKEERVKELFYLYWEDHFLDEYKDVSDFVYTCADHGINPTSALRTVRAKLRKYHPNEFEAVMEMFQKKYPKFYFIFDTDMSDVV